MKDEFYAQLLETFKIEAEEHLKKLSEELLNLEQIKDDSSSINIVETLFREAHSLKGAARAVNLNIIQDLCQSFEDVMAGLKQKMISRSKKLFEVLYQAIDALSHYIQTCNQPNQNPDHPLFHSIVSQLSLLQSQVQAKEDLDITAKAKVDEKSAEIPPVKSQNLAQEDSLGESPVKSDAPFSADRKTVRIAVSKLDRLLQESEEMLTVKLNSRQRLRELEDIQADVQKGLREMGRWDAHLQLMRKTFQQDQHLINPALLNYYLRHVQGLYEWSKNFLKTIDQKVNHSIKEASQDVRIFGGIIDTLLEDVKKVLMHSFSTITEVFPRMVRDLSASLGKDVRLEMQGGDIEIDRRILEELKDPLTHLIRNCIDHGIETSQERVQLNKPSYGTVLIRATQISGNFVEITVSDDGKGINDEKVKQAAVKQGVISQRQAEQMTPDEVRMLIFRSGISTSPIITNLSGRGLGLGIVAEKVEKLGGRVSVESFPKKGSAFILVLPLTMATFRGIQVRTGSYHFIIPTANVKRVIRRPREDRQMVENTATLYLDHQTLPFIELGRLLRLPVSANKPPEEAKRLILIILSASNTTIALSVDEIVNEQEIFVKGLGKQLARVKNVSSATITEWGTVIPILDPFDLVKSAVQSISAGQNEVVQEDNLQAEKTIILVVEDSMTARVLLKNILESAGYEVKTAVDGVEGLELLKKEKVDLVVSDVEMPRLNGFELTKKIREDSILNPLPVILCTTRGSKEDKEHGIEVGANAYIDKNSFEQGHFFELIEKLI